MDNMKIMLLTLLTGLTSLLLVQSYQSNLNVNKFFKQSSLAHKQYRYLLGEHRHHSPAIKKSINDLMLKHLFTPSGIHYSSVNRFLPKHYLFQIFFCISLFISLLHLPRFESLKRIVLMRFFKSHKISASLSFLCMMTVYALVFLKQAHILSYTLSGIFLSIVIYSRGYGERTFLIIMMSLIIQMSFNRTVTPLAPLINIIMTLIYASYFPLHLLSGILVQLTITEIPLNWLNQLTDFLILTFQALNTNFPTLTVTPTILMIFGCLYKRKVMALTLLLIFVSDPTHKDKEHEFWKNKRLKIKGPPKGGPIKNTFL